MLLPSALTCESSHPTRRYQPILFASPPLSPPSSQHPTITNLYSTCRALQSMLTTPTQLPSPPTTHAEMPSQLQSQSQQSPFKLRLRARKPEDPTGMAPRKRIAKRAPPRGLNKRRRAADDEMARESNDESSGDEYSHTDPQIHIPSTPKRMRFAPEALPLGLERSDFDVLAPAPAVEGETDADGETEEWTTEEDRVLVELVLEKLKLTKSDWQDCARSLGRDRGSVGKRWRSLMGAGDVGLKGRARRGKICSTWR